MVSSDVLGGGGFHGGGGGKMSSCMYSSYTDCTYPAVVGGGGDLGYFYPPGTAPGPGHLSPGAASVVSPGPRGAGGSKKVKTRSSYKHVPHRDKPPHLVQRRNARERRRVQAVNSAFVRLRRHIPYENRNKRLSKVKTLKIAIDYIDHMQQLITAYDTAAAAAAGGGGGKMAGGGQAAAAAQQQHYSMSGGGGGHQQPPRENNFYSNMFPQM